MVRFDYTEDSDISGFVYDEIGKMRPYELKKVYDAILQFRKEEEERREKEIMDWFHTSIVPILKEAVESFAGVLEITEDDQEVVATISVEGGFESCLQDSRIRMVLFLADSISTETMNGKVEVSLIYDRERLLK